MVKKTEKEVYDIVDLTITKPALYVVEIRGLDAMLMNKMPDLSEKGGNGPKEDPLEKERRTWREKAYYNEEGMLYVPGENIHECMKEASKYWGQKIPGEGNKTYTDVINKAVICEDMVFNIHKDSDDVIPFGKNVNGNPSKGKKSGSKVYKIRPLIRPWGGEFRIHVFDARLLPEILSIIMVYAGTYIGFCDWRPTFGRFELVGIRREA